MKAAEPAVWVMVCGDDVYELEMGEKYTVGRTDDNDLCVPIGSVSGEHAFVETTKEGDLYVTDRKSTNGTYVGKFKQWRSVGGGKRKSVPSGYYVAFGDENDPNCVFEMVYFDPSLEESVEEVDYGQAEPETREFPGLEVPKEAVSVDSKLIGDGNFGQVFQGKVSGLPKSVSPDGAVILKKAKDRVGGSEEMLMLELEMNHRISEKVPGVCADYLGFCDVELKTGGALYNKKLSDGLWLIWKAEARLTLEDHMSKQYPQSLLRALTGNPKGTELDAARLMMRPLLEGLGKLHKARYVHRDVKPPNILVDAGVVRLIDLGAAADLTDGFNYTPGVCPRDPRYCPPECDLMPEEAAVDESGELAPKLLKQSWKTYSPASFDIYSAGVLLVQLALKPVRSEAGLKRFNQEMELAGYDLIEWRDTTKLRLGNTDVLDANEGAGWELAASMLQRAPWAEGGRSSSSSGRPTAKEALKHPFFTA